MAIGLVYLASSSYGQLYDRECLCYSMSAGAATSWIKPSFDGRKASDCSSLSFRCRNPFFGALQSYWLTTGEDMALPKVRVAADYSEHMGNRGYHPLEEIKECEKYRNTLLTDAEIARTTVEANSKAFLVFPGRVHCEPHGHISWAEFQYVIDDYGDIFFELFDDENILQDRGASSPVTVLIGMDNPVFWDSAMVTRNSSSNLDSDSLVDMLFDDYYDEFGPMEITDTLIKWGMPDTLRQVHPLYFTKCLTKAIHSKYWRKMDFPLNELCIVGCLRPVFTDEESYLRRLFHHENDDDYMSDWRDESEKEEEQVAETYGLIDDSTLSLNSKGDESNTISTLYKLEVMTMELFSVYGDQSMIDLQSFQDAEPDILAHSASGIIERFSEYGTQYSIALKTLCRKKGFNVEGATLIGVDSLGMDVRAFSGVEARTLRFSFNARAASESAAEKKMKRMLFPRYHRKNPRSSNNVVRNLSS